MQQGHDWDRLNHSCRHEALVGGGAVVVVMVMVVVVVAVEVVEEAAVVAVVVRPSFTHQNTWTHLV